MEKNLLDKVFEAHGGFNNWKQYDEIAVNLRFGGLAFASKFNWKGLKERQFRIATKTPLVRICDYPSRGKNGVFTPEHVWIESSGGKRIKERWDPREAFKSFRHKIWWDDLDLLYFSAYACWNYFNSPFLLSEKNIEIKDVGLWDENGETLNRLLVVFPDSIPTHSSNQSFYFDDEHLLFRLDYDPEVFATWAKAAHYCQEFKSFSGIIIPTKRKVVPRTKSGKTRSWPILVWIEVNNVSFL